MLIKTLKLWKDREDVELTTFLSMPEAFIANAEPKPAIIVCPGGAYQRCPRHGTEGDSVAMSFAADGYQAFVLEYSVQERAPLGKTLFPAQLLDLGKAILTIRDHAKEWFVDSERIAIVGFSAGAHLCGMLATRWNDGLLETHFGVPAKVFKPLCAMLIYPITDYVVQEKFNHMHSNGLSDFPMVSKDGGNAFGDWNLTVFGCKEPDESALIDASPARHVTADCPPVFLAAAQNDNLVTAENSLLMASALQKAGIPYELHMFRYGDHGFGLGRNVIQPYRDDKVHACSQWVPQAKTFLLQMVAPETIACEANPFDEIVISGVNH